MKANPALLTDEEQASLRAALWFLHARVGSWERVEKLVRSKTENLQRLRAGHRINGMRALARRVAKIVGVDVGDVLAGRFPPKGTCHHCGR